MPSSWHVLITRTAISPRLATRILRILAILSDLSPLLAAATVPIHQFTGDPELAFNKSILFVELRFNLPPFGRADTASANGFDLVSEGGCGEVAHQRHRLSLQPSRCLP